MNKATADRVARLLRSAASAEQDAAGEFPGSYYRRAHSARARRYRKQAQRLVAAASDK